MSAEDKMYCKIGKIELENFEIRVQKREGVYIKIHEEEEIEKLHRRFWFLRNHYLKCIIKYKEFEYSGYVKVSGVSEPKSELYVSLSFEP